MQRPTSLRRSNVPDQICASARKSHHSRRDAPAPKRRIVHLVVVSGRRSAILTSTIWALAQETPPIIPDRITVLTTAVCRDALIRDLFGAEGAAPCRWDELRATLQQQGRDLSGRLVFGSTARDIKVFTAPGRNGRSRELNDLCTSEDFGYAADTLLEELHALTSVDDTEVIVSTTGGRKPLVSLLAGALGFVGRPQDRMIHTLINEPFDEPSLRPAFFFPPRDPVFHEYFDRTCGTVGRISSTAARINLVTVPLVRLRSLFKSEPHLWQSRYTVLAQAYENRVADLTTTVELSFDDPNGVLWINRCPVTLAGRMHPFVAFLMDRWKRKEAPFDRQEAAVEPLKAFVRRWLAAHVDPGFKYGGWARTATAQDIAAVLNRLRSRLVEHGLARAAGLLFPKNGACGLPLSGTVAFIEDSADGA